VRDAFRTLFREHTPDADKTGAERWLDGRGGTLVDSWEWARQVLEGAGLDPGRLAGVRPLTGGTYNTVEELLLTDGTRYVLKVPPASTVPGLRYERELLVAEAEFYRAAAVAEVTAPHVVAVGARTEVPHLLMTACPGEPWDGSVTESERPPLRRELGRQVARLHTVTGPGFGYPSGALGPLAPDWRTAFAAMIEAILDDARDYGARLPRSVEQVERALRAGYPALDEVTVPALVHFDLWDGNILLHRPADGELRIGGLIDGERMFWGDPLADFVSLALLGDIRKDEAFLAGYREAGGRAEFDVPARVRLALYRAYLYLIMLTETVPRAVDDEKERWVQSAVAPELVAALDEIEALARVTGA
jgi:aminoglycoside phosphotransferase (APT) family kinase protein